MKAISAVITTIMLLMISVSLIGVFYVFSSTLATQTTSSGSAQASQFMGQLSMCMQVDNIYKNQVTLRNCGKGVIENKSLVVMMDDVKLGASTNTIQEGNSSVVNVTGLWQIPFGTHSLKISNGAAVAQNLVDVQPNKDGLVGSWNFDEGSGNRANDGSGNGNTGNLKESAVGNPTFSPDSCGPFENSPQNTLQKDNVWGSFGGSDCWSAYATDGSWTWNFGNLKERTLYARWYAQTTQYPPSYCIDTTFRMEASPDGNIWTTIRTFTYTAANTSPIYEDSIKGYYRYVRASWTSSGACLVYPAEIFVDGVWSESSEPQWVSGKFNKGLQFDGVNDYVNVPDSAAWDFGGDFSVGSWVQWGDLTASAILGDGWNTGWMLYYAASGKLIFYVAGVTRANGADGSFIPVVGGWYHLIVQRNGSTIKIYVNGMEYASGTYATAITSTNPIYIGSDIADGSYFNGTIDEVRVWNKALAPDETVSMKQII